MFHFFSKFYDQFLIDLWIHILAKQVQNEPIPESKTPYYPVNSALFNISKLSYNHQGSQWTQREDHDTEQNSHGRQESEDQQPEPKNNEDLFVHDVQWQNAKSIFLLQGAGGSVGAERAFSELREVLVHRTDIRIDAIRGYAGHLCECHNGSAVVPERSAQENVDKENLPNLLSLVTF